VLEKETEPSPRADVLSPILSLAHTNQVVAKAEELVKQLRKRAEAYHTNQLLVLVGDDFKWSKARLAYYSYSYNGYTYYGHTYYTFTRR